MSVRFPSDRGGPDEEPPWHLFEDVQGYAMYLLDAQGRVASWNVGAERISGYPAEEVMGRFHSCFYLQEDILLGKPEQALQVARMKGRFEEEGWRLRRDGSQLFVNIAYTALYHPDGRLRGFSKIVRDITERRLYEEALRDANRRLATTLESISDGYCSIDREQRFTFVNPAAERLFGRRRADLIGLRVVDAFPFFVGSRFDQDFQKAMANGAMVEFEAPYPPSRSWFEVRAYPSEVGLSIYFRDVTEPRRTRVAQRLLAETGKQLSESLDYGLTIDRVAHVAVPELADWCVALVGQAGELPKHVSIAHTDPLEQDWARALFARIGPHLNPDFGLGKALRDGVAEILTEIPDSYLVSMATGEEEVAHLRRLGLSTAMMVPLRARGRTLGAIAWVATGPDRRYGPSELALAEEIAHRAALAVDNAMLYSEAQVAIQAREDMVAVATHDLRTPIQSLKLDVQTQLRRLRHPSAIPAAELAEALRRIDRQVARLAQLVTYFLEISKAAAGELEVHLEQVDAAALVREVVARAQSQRDPSGSAITVCADQPEIGFWDGIRLEQVVSNLLSNALKFGRGKPVEVSVEGHDHTTYIRVRDHGVGIPPSDQTLIFERFRRGVATEPFSGAGLGLYIVQRVVAALGGSVSVDSKLGEGATFTIELPRRDPPS